MVILDHSSPYVHGLRPIRQNLDPQSPGLTRCYQHCLNSGGYYSFIDQAVLASLSVQSHLWPLILLSFHDGYAVRTHRDENLPHPLTLPHRCSLPRPPPSHHRPQPLHRLPPLRHPLLSCLRQWCHPRPTAVDCQYLHAASSVCISTCR